MNSSKGKKSKATYVSLLVEFNNFYNELENFYPMMLRDGSVPYPKTLDEMQSEVAGS